MPQFSWNPHQTKFVPIVSKFYVYSLELGSFISNAHLNVRHQSLPAVKKYYATTEKP